MDPPSPFPLDAALAEERALVLSLGGLVVDLAGGTLVTNERVPVPRFNFVQEVAVAPERQSAFFEKALDHYFQRALRPSFRVGQPVPAHVDRSLRGFGFRPNLEDRALLTDAPASQVGGPRPPSRSLEVRAAVPEELDSLCRFWVGTREQEEFRRALEVAWAHPNPGERLAPWVATSSGSPVAAALWHSWKRVHGIHFVATESTARGRGAATALVQGVLARASALGNEPVTIESTSGRLERHLQGLGFRTVARWAVYELAPEAELRMPDPGPPQPPRWRPPRRSSTSA